eukprot:1376169-Lingulodinium_polyedra.AAC.1
MARDVSDLVRREGWVVRQICRERGRQGVTDGAIPVIVIFGSPCQDGTVAAGKGLRGWVGP